MPTATYIPRSLLNDNGGICSLRHPAEGLPTGWTRILVRRKNGNNIGKDDPYYFSPMQSYKFRSLPQVKRFLVCLEEAGGDEVAAYVNFRGGSNAGQSEAKIKASITVEKERKIFNMDPFEADPSPVMPSITFAEPSVQPDSQGTEAVVSSQGRVGKKRKLAHTAIPGHEQASESLLAGVSSRGKQRRMSQVILINKGGRVGIYLPDERRARIAKFHTKRKVRIWRKWIKYDCRKMSADSRPRIKGRFAKRLDVEECGVEGDGECESGGSFV